MRGGGETVRAAPPAAAPGDARGVIVHRTVAEWRAAAAARRGAGRTIGFVPTMGALHAGHAALARRAVAENGAALASIFVNPAQFDDPRDFETYPQTLEADLALLGAAGVEDVFAPSVAEMYPEGRTFDVVEREVSRLLEGVHRPGHFTGMLTVVLKLLAIAGAERAYFGEKDWQQLALVRRMVRAFHLPVEIVACPTVREPDGLALSSRNVRLTPAERALAPLLHRVLVEAPDVAAAEADLAAAGFRVEYVAEWDGRRLAAAWLGRTRLIDNVPAAPPGPA